MHHLGRARRLAAEDLADALVAEAHAEHRHAPRRRSAGSRVADDAGVLGAARAGRDQHGVGLERQRLVDGRARRCGGRPARRRAHPGTGRGCRRTSRSCRSRARGSHPTSLPRTGPTCRTGWPPGSPPVRPRRLSGRGTSEEEGRAGDAQGDRRPEGPDGGHADGARSPRVSDSGVTASSRYTPPVPAKVKGPSPLWVPVLMFGLLDRRRAGDHPQLPGAAARRAAQPLPAPRPGRDPRRLHGRHAVPLTCPQAGRRSDGRRVTTV